MKEEKEYSIKQRLVKGELDITELLSMSFLIFKSKFAVFFIIILLFSVPLNIVMFIYPMPLLKLDMTAQFAFNENFFKPFFINLFFNSVLTSLQICSIVFIVKKILLNKHIDANQAVIYSIKKLPQVFMTVTLFTISISIGTLFLIIPGILAGIFFCFSVYISAIREEYGIAAFKYSASLVKKNVGKVIFVVSFIILFEVLFPMVLSSNILPANASDIYSIIYSVLSYTIFYLLTGYFNIVMTVLFFNFDYNYGQKVNKLV